MKWRETKLKWRKGKEGSYEKLDENTNRENSASQIVWCHNHNQTHNDNHMHIVIALTVTMLRVCSIPSLLLVVALWYFPRRTSWWTSNTVAATFQIPIIAGNMPLHQFRAVQSKCNDHCSEEGQQSGCNIDDEKNHHGFIRLALVSVRQRSSFDARKAHDFHNTYFETGAQKFGEDEYFRGTGWAAPRDENLNAARQR